ncbi:MAG: hypothetical protein AAGD35_22505 [Actinomycetota bacterium]
MIGWLVRLAMRLGLRWLILSALVQWAIRRFGRRKVDEARVELDELAAERLPAPVARAVTALPPEAKNVGGSAVVAARAARSAASTSRRAARFAGRASNQVSSVPASARGLADRVRHETAASRRRLRSQYLAEMVGPDAATDALLDIRTEPPFDGPVDDDGEWAESPHEWVPDPVAGGRRRFRRRPAPSVPRMRRSYRPAPKPWDDRHGGVTDG